MVHHGALVRSGPAIFACAHRREASAAEPALSSTSAPYSRTILRTPAHGYPGRVPYYICPRCKERSLDIDAREGFSTQAPACRHCGFGFLFELLDDYYPAQIGRAHV